MNFKLQFEASKIHDVASKYSYKRDESPLIELSPEVQKRGYLTLKELKDVCEWKTSRSRERVKINREDDVNEITKVCFETTNERLRIGSLLLLEGVEFPTASVILHFFHPDPYPILDFRALQSAGVERPAVYTFGFWNQFVDFTRGIASEQRVNMRTLDKAMWQWSKEGAGINQPAD